jgi:integrase
MDYYTKTPAKLKTAQEKANLKSIRIHDFRHSHASLLIELGYSPLLIAERLGDTVQTTMNTYSHLYPNKQSELVKQLDKINSTKLVPLIDD